MNTPFLPRPRSPVPGGVFLWGVVNTAQSRGYAGGSNLTGWRPIDAAPNASPQLAPQSGQPRCMWGFSVDRLSRATYSLAGDFEGLAKEITDAAERSYSAQAASCFSERHEKPRPGWRGGAFRTH